MMDRYRHIDRPIVCVLDPSKRVFQVVQVKGKALASGGFGISLLDEEIDKRTDHDADINDKQSAGKGPAGETLRHDLASSTQKCDVTDADSSMATCRALDETLSPSKKATEVLFIEEALFLHKQGLLSALSETDQRPLDTSQLYQLLPKMGVSLSIYLVYAHLRSQDFRVLRHDPKRLDILRQQQQPELSRDEALLLRRKVRASIQNAPPPCISNASDGTGPVPDPSSLKICWDVYNPSAQFAKTRPGLPDFCVTATYYNIPCVTFSHVKAMIHGNIPLKIATVSDTGT
jgi:hypothetical protein